MNQGRIWCVVSPNVGLPLLLGSVAITSLIVHASVMSHTTWMSHYWQGNRPVNAADNGSTASPLAMATPGYAITVAPGAASGASPASFVVTVTPTGDPGAAPVQTALIDPTRPAVSPPPADHPAPSQ